MSREGALWIGGLEPYMDEEFIRNSLALMGEDSIVSIKVIKNKFTGEPASYGFINFTSDANALMAMHKLNGKIIPNSTPPVRFKLNHNSTRLMPGEKDSSIWVGDLTPDVDDLQLFKFFSNRFQSIKSAKVVLDQSGFSKGYGFIRFGNEEEQQTALTSMQGVAGLGAKPIKVSLAIPKAKQAALANQQTSSAQLAASIAASISQVAPTANGATSVQQSGDYSSQQYWNNYNQYWSQYAAWSQYSQYYDQSNPAAAAAASGYYGQDASATSSQNASDPSSNSTAATMPDYSSSKPQKSVSILKPEKEKPKSITEGEPHELVEHASKKINYEELNKEYLSRSEDLWDAMTDSFWWSHGTDFNRI